MLRNLFPRVGGARDYALGRFRLKIGVTRVASSSDAEPQVLRYHAHRQRKDRVWGELPIMVNSIIDNRAEHR